MKILIRKTIKRLTVYILALAFLASPLSLFTDKAEAAKKSVRYTVLVLDTSGVEQFHYTVYDNPMWAQMGLYSASHEETYTSDSSVEYVKASALKFVENIEDLLDENYVAIVTYDHDDGRSVCDFTNDASELKSAIESIEPQEKCNRSIASGLGCARTMLENIDDEVAIKGVVLCTTGLTDAAGTEDYGHYDSSTVGSEWINLDTGINLYKYANAAIDEADILKLNNINIYVIGLFTPVEENMPDEVKNIADFFRLTAKDLSSGESFFYPVENPDEIEFAFDRLSSNLVGVTDIKLYVGDVMPINDKFVMRDEIGGSDGLPGIYYKMKWGPELFEESSNEMYKERLADATANSFNLAMISGCLSAAACSPGYLAQMYKDLGKAINPSFDDGDIYFFSYPGSVYNKPEAKRNGSEFAADEDLAFSIVSYPMIVDGTETDVILINARGTYTWYEGLMDGITQADQTFLNDYKAYSWPYDFMEDMFAGLDYYMENHPVIGTRPMKFLVCGHSLGGAAANLFAAKMNSLAANGTYGENLSKDDVFAYTFGAIDAVKERASTEMGPYTEGFENIINIYNFLDSFGPYGKKFFKPTGRLVRGKFGNMYYFTDSLSGVTEGGYTTHEIIGYVYALNRGEIDNRKNNGRVIFIYCPIDVEVTHGGTAVCSITDNTVNNADDGIIACVDGDTKVLYFPDGYDLDDTRIFITATDGGDMCFVSYDEAGDSDMCVLSDVILTAGKNFEVVPGKTAADGVMYVLDENGRRISTVNEDGTESEYDIEAESEEADACDTDVNETDDSAGKSKASESKKEGKEKNDDGYGTKEIILIIVLVTVIIVLSAVGIVIHRANNKKNKAET